ncbi:MAG: hypothetical protein US89_C0012G0023 [Candidatus Peregrinibacteria bacterium GW2011_GWF2_38_29]|nr:MAG: hypothetical protein US89_C0012G0023 [Candidatus Peregrinibacteria bacterium GW2011_GWF2_38_29]HBB02473.1 hypothetical protein [Candidatus Peregrinibacteria bacterium]
MTHFFFTQDSDAKGLAPDYFHQMESYLANPDVHMVGGDVRVHTKNPIVALLHAVDRETYRRLLVTSHCKPKTYGGNVALRASTLFRFGGHNLGYKRKANNALREALLNTLGKKSVVYGENAYISTNDRRECACVDEGIPYVYKNQRCWAANDFTYDRTTTDTTSATGDLTLQQRLPMIEFQLGEMLFKNVCTYLSFDARFDFQNFKEISKDELIANARENDALHTAILEMIGLFKNICEQFGTSIMVNDRLEVTMRRISPAIQVAPIYEMCT